jgi:NADPH-dependent 2,4-dienoyl-CoA reductase/sulfur reductase-like enzyme
VIAIERSYDVAIIGAGPAGLAAATLCAEQGLAVALFDEHSSPGGQIYRNVMASPIRHPEILGDDYWHGATLVRAFERSGATYVPDATVWAVTRSPDARGSGLELGVSTGPPASRHAQFVTARAVGLATGAQERPFAIPGWTLPGVMMAGAAQLLLKTAAEVPAGRTVLAGSGPLLWLLAWQYLKAGVPIEALLDTTPRGRLVQALPHAWRFARSDYLGKGLTLLREVRAQVRVIERVSALAAEGGEKLNAVRYEVDGRNTTVAADLLLLHQGVVANINLSNAIGCEQRWNEAQACFEPVIDVWGGTSVEGVYVAGDAGVVAGAQAAEASGRLVALAVANAVGRIDGRTRDRLAVKPGKALARAMRGRQFLETLYRPADAFRIPSGDTIVCRCEEVTAQQVIDTVAVGCGGPNQMKSFLRCGMGPCQGRFCGLTVTELIARERGVSPAEVGYYRLRFPVKPVTLGELAELPADEAAVRAVDRVGTH